LVLAGRVYFHTHTHTHTHTTLSISFLKKKMASRSISAEELQRISKEGALNQSKVLDKRAEICREACLNALQRAFTTESIAAARQGQNATSFFLPDVKVGLRHGGGRCEFDIVTMQSYATEASRIATPGVQVSVENVAYDKADFTCFMAHLKWK
jgi:hypothetical protein